MRFFLLVTMGVSLVATAPCWAQEPAATPDMERRLTLADRYLELSQGSGVSKVMRRMFEEAFAKSDAPADEREWLTENMTITMEQVMRATFLDLRDEVAELYTEAELEAAIAFRDSPLGRSVTDKSIELSQSLQEAMLPHAMTAFAKLGDKFCVRFSCEEEAGLAAKN